MILKIYDENPNYQDVLKVVKCLENGGIIVLPTDTLYAFACSMNYKKAVEKMALLKGTSLGKAKFSLLCNDISQLSEYTKPLDKDSYQLLRSCLPGPYTFIMDANGNIPRIYQNPNKTIGLRVPHNPIAHAILEMLGHPMLATSVRVENEDMESEYLTNPELIHELFHRRVDMVIDGGIGQDIPSTVVDCSNGNLEVIRYGKGEIDI